MLLINFAKHTMGLEKNVWNENSKVLKEIHLSDTEFNVLKAISNNRWMTSREISEYIWGEYGIENYYKCRYAIGQAVYRMRKKGIEIKSSVGYGYLLKEEIYIE